MKYFGVIAFLTVLVACVYASNSTWGIKGASDVMIFRTDIIQKGQPNRILSYNATFPVRSGANKRVITQVRAIDLVRGGGGGIAKLTRGGPGQKFVSVIYNSTAPSRPLNFTMEVWARR